PAIEVKDLNFSIREFPILRGLDLHIERGTIFGLLGPNGAGKTTTLRLLLGKLVPTSGSIAVLGVEPRQGDAAWRARLGWMGEAPGHYGRLSAHANLLFFGGLYGVPPARAEKLLTDFGLWEKRNVAARALSKGQRQKLALARALLAEPEILFLDEPTSGMDVESARSLREHVRDWASRGKTVILTTHDMEEAEDLCAAIGFVEGGQIVASGTPESLCREVLQQEYVKR
ncbi:unnamed protein product, partial [Phaeothamnion confervicola]